MKEFPGNSERHIINNMSKFIYARRVLILHVHQAVLRLKFFHRLLLCEGAWHYLRVLKVEVEEGIELLAAPVGAPRDGGVILRPSPCCLL